MLSTVNLGACLGVRADRTDPLAESDRTDGREAFRGRGSISSIPISTRLLADFGFSTDRETVVGVNLPWNLPPVMETSQGPLKLPARRPRSCAAATREGTLGPA